MSKRHSGIPSETPTLRRNATSALGPATALWALCNDRGLLPGESSAAAAIGLTPSRWNELISRTNGHEGDQPTNAELELAKRWMIGTDLGASATHPARAVVRQHRYATLAQALKNTWPKRPAHRAEALTATEAAWHQPATLRGATRTKLREIWTYRACFIHFPNDEPTLAKMLASPKLRHTLAEELAIDEDDDEELTRAFSAQRSNHRSLHALEFAAAQAMRGGTERERVSAIWLSAIACEALGKSQRAGRLYEQIETLERTEHYQQKEWGEPRPGDAGRRHRWLMWTSGDPDTMREALKVGLSTPCATQRTWTEHSRDQWRGKTGQTQIDHIATRLERLRRAQASGSNIDTARRELAEAYYDCRLMAQAITQIWERAEDPEEEWRLACIGARALAENRATPEKSRELWNRALSARPNDPTATLGIAETEADQKLAQSAALWAIRAMWHDRHRQTLTPEQLNDASEIIAAAGHHATSARADRRIIAFGRQRLDVITGVSLAQRALERSETKWFNTMNYALDAIAVERYGIALLSMLTSQVIREHPNNATNAPTHAAEAETLRQKIASERARPSRYQPQRPTPTNQTITRTLRYEPRELQKLLGRVPEPLALGIRAQRAAHVLEANEEQKPLTGATALRTATLWEEWGLRCPDSGHPGDERARATIKRNRARLQIRAESDLEWHGAERNHD